MVSYKTRMTRKVPDILMSMPRSVRGAYILEFCIERSIGIEVGKLGEVEFEPGWYYYLGSARNGLRGRLMRHVLGEGKQYWHVDYLTRVMAPVRIWCVYSDEPLEEKMHEFVSSRAKIAINRFGCGDSRVAKSHLFYSKIRKNFYGEMKALGKACEINMLK